MQRDKKLSLGIGLDQSKEGRESMIRYLNLKLASLGLATYEKVASQELELSHALIENFKEKNRLLSDYYCPTDKRIQDFLTSYLNDLELESVPSLPTNTLILDRYGLARELSIPPDQDSYDTDIVHSYRIKQGVLNNPKNDRRTTKGVFHIAEGGLPIPLDKKAVPKITFAHILSAAFNPPSSLKKLPFTSSQEKQAETFVSLMLQPIVCPEVLGYTNERRMEIRFFVPGNLVSNLDFVESIFGNAGDPYLPENDLGLDPKHYTGTTGCVVLAPHLIELTKKEIGLPHISEANERQIKDEMCWEKEDEKYNNGSPFKICARDERGVMVTIIADNYYGYSKKEVKTQIGYSANLLGLVEEEHAGGALAFPAWNLAQKVEKEIITEEGQFKFADIKEYLGDHVDIQENGLGCDSRFQNIFYVQENTVFEIDYQNNQQVFTWFYDGKEYKEQVIYGHTYIYPSGFRVCLAKHLTEDIWRFVGVSPKGTLIHKPCTVSGGGKSEISKSIRDAIIYAPIFVENLSNDLEEVKKIVDFDYSERFKENDDRRSTQSRSFLSSQRSLGSVIKLLNPSIENSDAYNSWLETIPNRIKSFAFVLKKYYREEWGGDWMSFFSVDTINGEDGHELKYKDTKVMGSYLRVGLKEDGTWWTCKLRHDYLPSEKLQWEDDISASIVVPTQNLKGIDKEFKNLSMKIVKNCENRFFQRPDEAVNRGYDRQAEIDLASSNQFISNFEPLKQKNAIEIFNKSITYYEYTDPIKDLISDVTASDKDQFFVSSSHPRIVDGKPTKNPRYLQQSPYLEDDRKMYLGLTCTRMNQRLSHKEPLHIPVHSVISGRRNNPANKEIGIRALAVFNPLHYQELPELFMDFVCSLTGKSPSTTGAGSEGALTKGPFNALSPTSDLNNALLSFILCGYNGYSTAAGHIGPKYRMDHDVSILIPDLWSRLTEEERTFGNMKSNGFFEKLDDFEYEGEVIHASRLGFRITKKFVNNHLGRVFENPNSVFGEEVLKPELQDREAYIDGIKNITEAQQRVAKFYIEDGSVEAAIPPLKALLYIMATGEYEGLTIDDPKVRGLFERDYVLDSDWYQERLDAKIVYEKNFCLNSISRLEKHLMSIDNQDESHVEDLNTRLKTVKAELQRLERSGYRDTLIGTIGRDILYK